LVERDVVFEAGDQAHHRWENILTEGVVDPPVPVERWIAIGRHAFGGVADRRGVHPVQVEAQAPPTIARLVEGNVAEREDRLDIIVVGAGVRWRPFRNSSEAFFHHVGVVDAARRGSQHEGCKRQIKQRFHRSGARDTGN
jgi:hypothetical protein